jgi:chromosome condensin MukBEF MukE localization factor
MRVSTIERSKLKQNADSKIASTLRNSDIYTLGNNNNTYKITDELIRLLYEIYLES